MKSPTSTLVSPPASNLPDLPNYLRETEPMELDAIPLQLALLTMEVRNQRIMLQRMAVILETASRMMQAPGLGLDDG